MLPLLVLLPLRLSRRQGGLQFVYKAQHCAADADEDSRRLSMFHGSHPLRPILACSQPIMSKAQLRLWR
jgi:hypothetical protein